MVDKYLIPKLAYPQASRDETIVHDFHGQKIKNPYQWLEDPDSEKTQCFVDKLNKVSVKYINQCPIRQEIQNGLKDIIDYPKYSCPQKEGNFYFYSHNTGLQNQSVLYKQDTLDAKPVVFLDPNELSTDGTVALSQKSFCKDGTMMAYGLSAKGSDWVTVKIKLTESGTDLQDVLERLRYSSLAWTHDNKGLFYNRYPDDSADASGKNASKNQYHRLYYHQLGTDQSDDVLCCEFPDNPNYMIGAEVTDDGRFLIVSVDKGCDPNNLVYYYDLDNGIEENIALTPIIDVFESKFNFINNDGHLFTFLTDHNAPMFQLIQIDVKRRDKSNWKVLIKEEKNKLDWATRVNENNIILCYIEDAKNKLCVHEYSSGQFLFNIPLEIGSVSKLSGKKELSEIFFATQSFLSPDTIFYMDLKNEDKTAEIFREVQVTGIDRKNFTVEQIFYRSKDGTRVPMFIFYKKDVKLDGSNPTLLYGYGGFNASMTPYFNSFRAFFAKHFNGVVAIPNIRGGDEYGKKWHEDGMLGKKQNVFDDFIAAAEYLIDHKYTNKNKLIIQGHSNGGLLAGACLNQRPDLFGCVLAHVGVMDMLRFHLFTIGHAWVPEYGNPDDEADFKNLIKYSPLHNIKAPNDDDPYPAVLLMTADHDDRVVPSHSLKFIAEAYHLWRNIEKPRLPFLARIEVKAGHGSGKPTSKIIEENSDVASFVANVLDLKWNP